MLKTPLQWGFSLTEMMVALVIMGILLAVAAPNLSTWVQNGKIRTATGAIQNGLQLARAEAVHRNALVRFDLAADGGWTVSEDAVGGAQIQNRPGAEGSTNVTFTVTPAGAASATFNGLGQIRTLNTDGSNPLSQIVLSGAAGTVALQINISSGGQIKSCNQPAAPGPCP